MTVVRITIKKNLTERASSYRQSLGGPFASEYLVRTDAPFPSEQLQQYAKSIALAESRLLPTTVIFTGAVVKLAMPGATPESLCGQYSNVDLEKLRGEIALNEENTLAFPGVVAVYSREANWGRHGRLTIPHVLTAAEWNDYAHKRSVPLRFQRPIECAPLKWTRRKGTVCYFI